jgi:hypothetical protein
MLCGCATPYPQRFRVAGLRWIVADPDAVSRHCLRGVHVMDDGSPKTFDTQAKCCYVEAQNTIFMGRGEEDCALHELAHATGMPASFVDKYIHNDGRPVPHQPLHVTP